MVRVLCELANDDEWDVLVAARKIAEEVQVSAGVRRRDKPNARRDTIVRDEAKRRTQGQEDYYTPAMLKRLEGAIRRELSARERSGMIEALAAAESFLRDVLICCEGALEPIVNEDVAEAVDRIARASSTPGIVASLDACRNAARDDEHRVQREGREKGDPGRAQQPFFSEGRSGKLQDHGNGIGGKRDKE
jgi:DNA polymerase-3 subunit delta'